MRYLYYCNSTYQLLTVMNLHWHRKNAGFENIDDYKADLILLNAFNGAEDVVRILKENKVFDDVTLIERKFNQGSFHRIKTVLDVLFPFYYLKNKYDLDKKYIRDRYDVITVPKYSTIVGAIWRVNKDADLHLYEDGLGTYYLNVDLLIPHARSYRFMYEKGLAKDFTNFSSLYLNAPELYSGTWNKNVLGVPKFDKNYLKEVQKMFSEFSSIDNEDNKDIYWLAQTLENDETIRIISDVLATLEKHKERVLYCPHPRWPEKEKPIYDMAPDKQIWEMKLLNMNDIDRKCFVSIHSTACLTPKLLFDEEPYLILFYHLIDDKVIERNEQFEHTMKLFIDTYKHKERIMLPKTKDEFVECVDKFIKINEN